VNLFLGAISLTSVVILEDNEILLNRLADILKQSEICSDVRIADTVASCEKLLRENHADILLADLHLPDGSGIDSIRLFKQINPDGLAIVISALSDGTSIMKALEFGAMGYLHKDDSSLQIVDAIQMALEGKSPMSSSIAYSLVCRIQDTSLAGLPTSSEPSSKPNTLLTIRETEILDLIAKGLSYAETAVVLKISTQTVPVHIRNIYKKLHANNRSEAVYEARAIGIIK
jgi:DNA-binding NarL/FixJ family response regulator